MGGGEKTKCFPGTGRRDYRGGEKLMEYIIKFYKELFGHPEESSISLKEMDMNKLMDRRKRSFWLLFP